MTVNKVSLNDRFDIEKDSDCFWDSGPCEVNAQSGYS